MILPESGRVVVIDDKFEEIATLVKVLSKYRVAITYFSGREEELPERPFSDVRIVFLDVVLEGLTGKEERTIISTIMGIIKRIIDKNNGPFVLAIWTKHPEYIKSMERILVEEGYQIAIINLEKSDFFDIDGTLKREHIEMFKVLNRKLYENLGNLKSFNIFIQWENVVHNSASKTVNEFSKFIDFDDEWDEEILKLFYNLAKARAGKMLDNIDNPGEIFKNALLTFKGIFDDVLEKEIHCADISLPESSLEAENLDDSIVGKVNSRLLLDTAISPDSDNIYYPGNVYIIEDEEEDGYKARLIRDSINWFAVKEKYNELYGSIDDKSIYSKSKPSRNKFQSEFKEQLIQKAKFVKLEITPLCDFVQKKSIFSRIVFGFLCPQKIFIRINDEDIEFIVTELIKQKTEFLYISPVFEYNNDLYFLVFDFRYFSSIPIEKIQNKSPIFRLRKELFTDIQTKLASHINRPGILYLE